MPVVESDTPWARERMNEGLELLISNRTPPSATRICQRILKLKEREPTPDEEETPLVDLKEEAQDYKGILLRARQQVSK